MISKKRSNFYSKGKENDQVNIIECSKLSVCELKWETKIFKWTKYQYHPLTNQKNDRKIIELWTQVNEKNECSELNVWTEMRVETEIVNLDGERK